ncbi:MAG: YlxR family protein [Anaerolineae bacterium]|nr:YlxR family protein [Candidatus Roseilinea sp.]MDW8449969.1 YlxR family protein [Anaerolineae bacterium]
MSRTKRKRSGGKHVPMRTCIGTRTQHPKRDMIRLIRTDDGHVVIDLTGKRSGSRGAYLSKSRAAAEQAIKHKRLEAAFGQPVLKEDEEAILAFFSQFD